MQSDVSCSDPRRLDQQCHLLLRHLFLLSSIRLLFSFSSFFVDSLDARSRSQFPSLLFPPVAVSNRSFFYHQPERIEPSAVTVVIGM